MAMTPYQKAIKKLVGIRQPDPLGTGVKTTTGAAAGESVKPAAGGVTSGASPSILPGTPGQGAVTKPVGTPGQAQVTNLPQQKNAYQQAVDAVTPTGQQYTSFYKPPAGFGAMSADDQAVWNGIGQKYAAGDRSWMQDTNTFRNDGNWGSYTDANGNINGWLQVHDGNGGFTPVFGGRLGETGYAPGAVFSAPDGTAYVVGDDGTLKASGTMNYAKYGEYIGPRDGSLHGTFRASDGKTYDYDSLTPEQAAMFGLVNSEGGGARVGSVPEMTDQALAQGATTPEIAALVREDERAKAMGLPMPGASASGGEGSLDGADAGLPRDAPERTPYQAYMDQWDYPAAPEWEGTEYQAKRDAALEAAGEKWTPSEYQQKRDDALSRAEQMQWNYDPNTDPVWQAYQKQYRREGQRATQDTLGKYAQLTGGQPSSYAATAAAQAGNYYASQLSDKLPELYQDAYNRYLQEFQRQLGISDQYQGFDDREYSRWADQQGRNFDVADRYNQYGEQDYDKYRDRLSQYNTDRNFSYGQYRDAVGDYRYDDETAYNRNYQAQRDAINDQRYDQEWAQQLREYADSQNWKAKDWEQYLREYEDKLSNQEREWAYQQYRDAVSDARYDQEYADSRADTAYSRALAEEEQAYNRAWDEENRDYTRNWNEDEREYERGWDTTKWNQTLREYDDDQAQQALNNEYKMSGKTSASGGSSSKSTGGTKTPSSNLPSGQYQQNGYTYLSGKTHPDGQPMTAMYDQAYQDTWNKWQSGLDYGVLLKEIANLTTSKTITDAEGQMILRDLQSWRAQGRNREASAGGGGSSQWTQMTR